MKTSLAVFTALALGGCSMTAKDGTPIVTDGSLTGAVSELSNPGSTYKRREAEDDARCRQFGFKPGTEAYGNCRLQRDQIRATNHAATAAAARSQSAAPSQSNGMSLLCKDAISRRDNGGVFVHC